VPEEVGLRIGGGQDGIGVEWNGWCVHPTWFVDCLPTPAFQAVSSRPVAALSARVHSELVLTHPHPPISAQNISTRPVVALSARVHPGESNSSWMMRGVVRLLTSLPLLWGYRRFLPAPLWPSSPACFPILS
jgi:hypothetical protein